MTWRRVVIVTVVVVVVVVFAYSSGWLIKQTAYYEHEWKRFIISEAKLRQFYKYI